MSPDRTERESHEPHSAGEVGYRFLEILVRRAEATGNPEYAPPEWLKDALELRRRGETARADAILREHEAAAEEDDERLAPEWAGLAMELREAGDEAGARAVVAEHTGAPDPDRDEPLTLF